MPVVLHNPDTVFPPYRCFSHAAEIKGDSRLLIVSGINGYQLDGKTMPESFEDQADLIWTHLGNILKAANMGYRDIVSLRTYLAKPEYREAHTQMRMKYLGDHKPSVTVVCAQLLLPEWKLEMEAMAAK
jgi:2-iminobutanoate/2-iminopropanoate deaminase